MEMTYQKIHSLAGDVDLEPVFQGFLMQEIAKQA